MTIKFTSSETFEEVAVGVLSTLAVVAVPVLIILASA